MDLNILPVAILAGALTVLAPCVLPILPLVVGSAFQQNRFGPLAVGLGMALSFSGLTIALASPESLFYMERGMVRQMSAILLIASGALLLVTGLVLMSGVLDAMHDELIAPFPRGLRRFISYLEYLD